MRFIKKETHFDFLKIQKPNIIVSLLVVLAGVAAYFPMGGFNFGIDFRGGTLVQIRFAEKPDLGQIRSQLNQGGFSGYTIQTFGDESDHEVLVSLPIAEEVRLSGPNSSVEDNSMSKQVERHLVKTWPSLTVRRVETVGPKVGSALKYQALSAIVFAILAILAYVWFRFEWRYSVASVVALLHDVVIVTQLFIFTQKEMTLSVVAGILTLAGYSINDTIVIMDRIRENVHKHPKQPMYDTINQSVNQTLSRTILTSGLTLLVVIALFFFGGEIIHDFAFTLLVGIILGTYSSLYIASPILLYLTNKYPKTPKK